MALEGALRPMRLPWQEAVALATTPTRVTHHDRDAHEVALQHEVGDDVLAYGSPRPSRVDAASTSAPRTTTAIPA
jgi:hypothetical protein